MELARSQSVGQSVSRSVCLSVRLSVCRSVRQLAQTLWIPAASLGVPGTRRPTVSKEGLDPLDGDDGRVEGAQQHSRQGLAGEQPQHLAGGQEANTVMWGGVERDSAIRHGGHEQAVMAAGGAVRYKRRT